MGMWQKLRSELRLICAQLEIEPINDAQIKALHDAAFHLQFGWQLDILASPGHAAAALMKEATRRVAAESRRKRQARLSAWAVSLQEFNDPSSIRSHQYLRNKWSRQVTAVSEPDGTLVTSLPEMDKLVAAEWQKVSEPSGVTLQQSRAALAEAAALLEPFPSLVLSLLAQQRKLNCAGHRECEGGIQAI
eukprot:3551437-Amphidinium_carterae.2